MWEYEARRVGEWDVFADEEAAEVDDGDGAAPLISDEAVPRIGGGSRTAAGGERGSGGKEDGAAREEY